MSVNHVVLVKILLIPVVALGFLFGLVYEALLFGFSLGREMLAP